MSQINDALNKAKQAAPRNLPNVMQPLSPAAEEHSPPAVWVIPAVVIVLIVAAIFFIGWAAAHNTVRDIRSHPDPVQQDETVIAAPDTNATATASSPGTNATQATPPPPELPALQAIFYSDTAPTAILDGKTVAPGDKFGDFKVKAITKYTVTLTGPDKKEYQIGM